MSWKRGAYPEFTLEDVIATMFLLKEPTGRKLISEMLDLGEGSVRTILKKLGFLDLIRSTQRGHSLSDRGKEILEKIEKHFSEVHKAGKVEGFPAYAILIRKPGSFKSIELRDEAVRYFAKGAMVLTVKDGEPVFPEDMRALSETMPELAEDIKNAFEAEDGDMVVVTWAENSADAMKSAYHVALFLKGEHIPEEIKSLVR
ncbi:hypothetical protein A3L09_03235 [Thermococcus profundus]|uniref:Uncharacterized protein n=1 Tax=Thermococcus profundus TaxID=49899 RepID=A0A2Z2MA87_THEPR|nr:DUF4443 domain-containing protein [Thermococcus profundus]ASJ02333.1 hypothetical protein A3L09_03235 [Thermococcus profundus]